MDTSSAVTQLIVYTLLIASPVVAFLIFGKRLFTKSRDQKYKKVVGLLFIAFALYTAYIFIAGIYKMRQL